MKNIRNTIDSIMNHTTSFVRDFKVDNSFGKKDVVIKIPISKIIRDEEPFKSLNPVDNAQRERLKDSLDKILAGYKYDKKVMDVSVESKVFGIGVESYTTGSNEFYLNYAASRNICCLLDTGHFHPTENVADKISSMYCFYNKLAFHVSRPVRWDSDHVLKLNDDLQDVADELVKCDGLKRSYIGLDYFDYLEFATAFIIQIIEQSHIVGVLTTIELFSCGVPKCPTRAIT